MERITLEEARERLRDAEARYRAVEEKRNQTYQGVATAERVLAQVEVQAELERAARVLLEAKEVHAQVDKATTEKRRERGRVQLEAVESELVGAISEAEADLADLEASLGRVLNLSKKRYAHRQEATGRAPRSLLARSAVYGWMTWRLSGLDLPDMDNPPRHYRAPLAELLGLTASETNTTDDDGGEL